MSEEDLHKKLLGQGKKGGQSYIKKVDQIQNQIQLIKNKNNLLQKQSDNDIDGDIKTQIYQQSKFMEQQINKIKKLLNDFSQQFKEPISKNKLRQLWKNASKQIQRNKIIVQRIVNQAPSSSFFKDKRLEKNISEDKRKSKNSINKQQKVKINLNYVTKPIYEQQYNQSDQKIQQDILKQKKQIINHLQQRNEKINKIMNQMALFLDQQAKDINILTENNKQARQNTQAANEQLNGAIKQQKKGKSKCCRIMEILILLCIILTGIVIILMFN